MCIKPIQVYCNEIWSLNIVKSNVDLESKYLSMLPVKVQIKFAKALFGVNKQAVNLAVLGELGMYPISIQALKSAIEYWLHILKSENTLLFMTLLEVYPTALWQGLKYFWISFISPMFGIIKVLFLTSDFFTQFMKNWLKILICSGKLDFFLTVWLLKWK